MAPSMFPLSLRNSVWFRVQMATLVYIDPGHETESSAPAGSSTAIHRHTHLEPIETERD